ncbi:MAG: Rrf2 family transcriptional regulator [Candidatus Bipolaricaulota bacterium]|nr:Rrf2 family transcriptional regulator [Candidatus Bipolaricaulota bacterium]
MAELVRMSEATAIGMHAMLVLAAADGPLPASSTAGNLDVSPAHLSKVLQALARAGLLEARRGPNGGYTLARPSAEIRLLDIYEALEGPLRQDGCLFAKPVCRRSQCALGDVVSRVRRQVFEYLRSTTLADATEERR